ncbi:MAG: outer-membrane lipoprotein carrier protein LolA [[Clostridium] fimetarium]|nr:outer-membrane lipoprotein carrier protein LolA [Alistipes timonensis]MCM1406398.1 outer-membrane lipoprotein carrier protein LolA [[Clostridium] fimetarium]
MFKKIALLLAVLALSLPCPIAASAAKKPAAQVVAAIADAVAKSPAIEAAFTISRNGGKPASGTALIQGRKFTLDLPGFRTWFDGKTQWTYSEDAAEVNVTEPTPDELAESNPLTIVTASAAHCAARRLEAAAGTDKVELKPEGKSAFRKAVVTSDASTNFPKEIVVTMDDGSTVVIRFTSMKKVAKKPDSRFRYVKTMIPSARVVDLR